MSESSPKILMPSEIDFDRVNYSTPSNFPGGKLVYLNYQNDQNEKVPFLIRTPTLDCKNGLKIWKDNNADILLNLYENSEKNSELIKCLDSLDNKLLMDSTRYSFEWFKMKKISTEDSLQKLNKITKLDDSNNSYIKVKLNKKDDNWIPEIYDSNKESTTPENAIVPNCSMDSIIQIYAIHIRKDNNYGIILRLVQSKVYPPKNIIRGKCMILDSSDEEN